jgi:hypothetical protein
MSENSIDGVIQLVIVCVLYISAYMMVHKFLA